MSTPIIPGAESISIADGRNGGVLLLHGYMGTVQTVRDWALSFAQAGFAVEAPLLPGHGTKTEELATTQWSDYVSCAEAAYRKLLERHQHVFLGGLCTGGTLAAWLAIQHPETTAGLISINGFFKMPKHWSTDVSYFHELLKSNRPFFPWYRGKSVEDPSAPPVITYDQAPIAPMISLGLERIEICKRLNEVQCPVLAFTSLLSPEFSLEEDELWFKDVPGSVEHIVLERSNHIATLDYDKGIIEACSTEFALAIIKGEYVSKKVA